MPVRLYVNLNIFFNCKYKCDYKQISIQMHLSCTFNFVFIASLAHSPISEIIVLKIDMLLVFQNKMNIDIIEF